MSTRYIWSKRTYTSASLGNYVTGTPNWSGPHNTPGRSITIGTGYTAEINEYGKPVLVPTGNRKIILDYDNDIKQWGTYSGASYPYLILTMGVESFCQKISSSAYFWKVVLNEDTWMWEVTIVDSSGVQQNKNTQQQDLQYTYTTSNVTSSSRSTYPDGAFVNEQKGYFAYKTSDCIDPSAISVSGSGSSRTITITPSSTAQKLSGQVITYTYQVQRNGGSWSTIETTSDTSISYAIPSGTESYQFRVYAKDNLGFTSTTYVTSEIYYADKYTVSVIVSPTGSGTVSGTGSFYDGARVTLTAIPANGYDFVCWQEGAATISTEISYVFNISSDRTLTAVFKQKLALWVGVGGKARKGVELYVGVNGKARKVVEGYIGVNGKARRFL